MAMIESVKYTIKIHSRTHPGKLKRISAFISVNDTKYTMQSIQLKTLLEW